jgi:hypothetical protein
MLKRIIENYAGCTPDPDILVHSRQTCISTSSAVKIRHIELVIVNFKMPHPMRAGIFTMTVKKAAVMSDVMPEHRSAIIAAIYDTVSATGERAVLDVDILCPVGVMVPDAIGGCP